MLQSKFFSTS